jgi:hypothetical protein
MWTFSELSVDQFDFSCFREQADEMKTKTPATQCEGARSLQDRLSTTYGNHVGAYGSQSSASSSPDRRPQSNGR